MGDRMTPPITIPQYHKIIALPPIVTHPRDNAFQQALAQIKAAIECQDTNDENFVTPSIFLCYAWGIRSYECFVRETLKNDLNLAGFDEIILDEDANQRGNIDRFTAQMYTADIVIVIGTKRLNESHANTYRLSKKLRSLLPASSKLKL